MNKVKLDMLPITTLNALEYCPRRFYYECIAHYKTYGSDEVLLEKRGSCATAKEERTRLHRLWIWSAHFRLSGYVDVVEDRKRRFIPVEYRRGKMDDWLNASIQLCAQALCLEEMTHCPVHYGYIFTNDGGRREKVLFTAMLRQQTEASIHFAFTLLQQERFPPPLVVGQKRRTGLPTCHPKCRDCPLEPSCLPREVLMLERDAPHPLLKKTASPTVVSPFVVVNTLDIFE